MKQQITSEMMAFVQKAKELMDKDGRIVFFLENRDLDKNKWIALRSGKDGKNLSIIQLDESGIVFEDYVRCEISPMAVGPSPEDICRMIDEEINRLIVNPEDATEEEISRNAQGIDALRKIRQSMSALVPPAPVGTKGSIN